MLVGLWIKIQSRKHLEKLLTDRIAPVPANATKRGCCFAECYVKFKEQADRWVSAGYDAKAAARDAILYQTDNKNLMKKIISEDLNFDDIVKYGLAMEQGSHKVEQMRNQSS